MSPTATGTIRRGAGLPQLRRTGSRRRASPSLLPSSPPRLCCPSPETAVMSARLPASSPPRWQLLLSLLLLGAAPGPRRSAAFYLPGLAPVNFCEEEKKSDECKVGAAWRTPRCTVGRGSLPLPGGSRPLRGRGRSSGCGRVSPEARGVGRAVGRRLWNGLRTAVDSGGLGGPGSTSRWVQFSRNRNCVCTALAWRWRRAGQRAFHGRVSAHSPVSRLQGRGRPGLPVTCNFIASRFLLFWNPGWL